MRGGRGRTQRTRRPRHPTPSSQPPGPRAHAENTPRETHPRSARPPGAPAQSGVSYRICLSNSSFHFPNSIADSRANSAPRGSVYYAYCPRPSGRCRDPMHPTRPPAEPAALPPCIIDISLDLNRCAPMEHSQSPPCKAPANPPEIAPLPSHRDHIRLPTPSRHPHRDHARMRGANTPLIRTHAHKAYRRMSSSRSLPDRRLARFPFQASFSRPTIFFPT